MADNDAALAGDDNAFTETPFVGDHAHAEPVLTGADSSEVVAEAADAKAPLVEVNGAECASSDPASSRASRFSALETTSSSSSSSLGFASLHFRFRARFGSFADFLSDGAALRVETKGK